MKKSFCYHTKYGSRTLKIKIQFQKNLISTIYSTNSRTAVCALTKCVMTNPLKYLAVPNTSTTIVCATTTSESSWTTPIISLLSVLAKPGTAVPRLSQSWSHWDSHDSNNLMIITINAWYSLSVSSASSYSSVSCRIPSSAWPQRYQCLAQELSQPVPA